jgi:hypothetical protein
MTNLSFGLRQKLKALGLAAPEVADVHASPALAS